MTPKLLIGSRKGLIVYELNGKWKHHSTHFSGIPVSLACIDEFNGTWWACLDHGHWGCKLHRSHDQGKNWTELPAPVYPEGEEISEGVPATLRYIWAFASDGEKIYLGTEPGGLFVSRDNGASFELVRSLWDDPSRKAGQWFGGGRDHAGIHTVLIHPKKPDHIYVGVSCAGIFESKDGGLNWKVRNKGMQADFLPDPESEVGQDPHLLSMCKKHPEAIWQQNHCGIYRSTDGANSWLDVSEKEGPANFGFTICADENDPDLAFVVPAVSDEIRVAVDGNLMVCRTENGGKNWQQLCKGLPQLNCFDIVYRHAMDKRNADLAFGTTTGNLFVSADHGDSWICISNYLPMIYSVYFA